MLPCMILDSADEVGEFEELYYRYREPMFRVAQSVLHDTHMAEDAVSEAFLAIARHFEKIRFASESSKIAYCVIVSRNQAITIYRKRKSEMERTCEIPENTAAPNALGNDRTDLQQAMLQLPAKYKDILILKYHYGFTVKEIADMFSLPHETVRSRLKTAKKLLYPLLKPEKAKTDSAAFGQSKKFA